MANDLKYIQWKITYTDTTSTWIGRLPPGAYVVDICPNVLTAFNAGGNDYLDIGTSTLATYWTDDIPVNTTGKKRTVTDFTFTNGGVVVSALNPTDVYAIYVPTGSSPTTGEVMITIYYAYDEAND